MTDTFYRVTFDTNRLALGGLCIYRNLLNDSVIAACRALLDCAAVHPHNAPETFIELYSIFFNKLSFENSDVNFSNYLFDKVLLDENAFTTVAASHDQEINGSVKAAACYDISILKSISSITPANIKMLFLQDNEEAVRCQALIKSLPEWTMPQTAPCISYSRELFELWQAKSSDTTCQDFIEKLVHYHTENGYGIFAKHYAFTWQRSCCSSKGNNAGSLCMNGNIPGSSCLLPVRNPDPVRLTDLIAYETEREEVIRNTTQFLNGYTANNVLLYGDRGTGKSSTVKALLNEYSGHGLRMIEVPKHMLSNFSEIVDILANKPYKFIIFVDDLSFENNEDNYTALKAIIEGGLGKKPKNVLIYATSNRRHLIKENFSDRAGLQYGSSDDEIRAFDTLQEKLSLSDRFGITVVFSSPDKKRYLEIVDKLAQKNGIDMDIENLHKEALKWELWYNGRSPRTAQQFISWLQGNSHPQLP